jgi:hypothetical protein
MKTTLLLLAIAALASSCAPKAYPPGTPNPLDRPQDFKSAAELHAENMEAITSNPGYRLP